MADIVYIAPLPPAKVDSAGEYTGWDYALVRSMLDEIKAVYDYSRRSKYASKIPFKDIATEERHHLGEFNAALIHYYVKNPAVGRPFFEGILEYCDESGAWDDPAFSPICSFARDRAGQSH